MYIKNTDHHEANDMGSSRGTVSYKRHDSLLPLHVLRNGLRDVGSRSKYKLVLTLDINNGGGMARRTRAPPNLKPTPRFQPGTERYIRWQVCQPCDKPGCKLPLRHTVTMVNSASTTPAKWHADNRERWKEEGSRYAGDDCPPRYEEIEPAFAGSCSHHSRLRVQERAENAASRSGSRAGRPLPIDEGWRWFFFLFFISSPTPFCE